MMIKRTMMLAGFAAAVFLGGCGGEELPDPAVVTAPAAEGLWTGTLFFTPSKSASLLVTESGTFWMIYSKPGSTDVGGVIHATGGNPNGSSYTATSAREFNLEGLTGPNTINIVSTSLVAGTRFWGNLAYPASPSTVFPFQLAYNSNNNSARPSIVGTFSGTTGNKAGLTFSSTEIISALTVNTTSSAVSGVSTSGCTISGTIVPLADTNAYRVDLGFSAATSGACSNTTGVSSAVIGVAFIDANGKLNILAFNNLLTPTNGFVFRQG